MGTGQRYDIIVIGSGIGGLTAALTAANAGLGVLVLEAGKQFGGYTNPFKRGKYSFDPGLHYLGECGPGQQLTRILEKLGLADEIAFRELSPDGFDRLVFPGYEVTMPRGAARYHERLERDFPSERDGLARFFALLSAFREAIKAMTAIRGPGALLGVTPHVPFLARYGRATFSDLVNPLIKDPLLRSVLAGQGGDYGLPPGRGSALLALGILDHYLGGAYFPRGGSRAIRDGFVKAIERKGGVMLRNHAVERVVVSRDRVTGVRCESGEAFEASTIISNADAAVTYQKLIGEAHLPFLLRRKTKAMRPSVSSLCLFLGTSIDVAAAGMTDANIWHYSSVDIDGAYRPMLEGRFPEDDFFFFLSSPSLKDPDSTEKAPAGHHTLEAVMLAPFEPFAKWAGPGMKSTKRGGEYEALKAQLSDRMLGCVERYVPGIRDKVTVMELGTPATNVTYAAAPRGAIYGPEHAPDQMGPWRYGMKGAIPGLYLCGSSTMGAGIVPGAASGFAAGKMAVAAARG